VRGRRGERGSGIRLPLPWWLKVDDPSSVRRLSSYEPERLLVAVTDSSLARPAILSGLRGQFKNVTLALPTIIEEGRVQAYANGVAKLIKMGFKDWQIAHLSHLQLFPESQRKKLDIFGDYSLNILNTAALGVYQELGLKGCQLSIEAERDLIATLCRPKSTMLRGLTVYGLPPLFTARPKPHFFHYDRIFISPRGERFTLKKNFDQTIALPDRPFSLLPRMDEIVLLGLDYLVVDLTNMDPAKAGLANILQQHPGKSKKKGPSLSTFNFRGNLY